MPLATKNGSLIVKDGKVAENCNCCNECPLYAKFEWVDEPPPSQSPGVPATGDSFLDKQIFDIGFCACYWSGITLRRIRDGRTGLPCAFSGGVPRGGAHHSRMFNTGPRTYDSVDWSTSAIRVGTDGSSSGRSSYLYGSGDQSYFSDAYNTGSLLLYVLPTELRIKPPNLYYYQDQPFGVHHAGSNGLIYEGATVPNPWTGSGSYRYKIVPSTLAESDAAWQASLGRSLKDCNGTYFAKPDAPWTAEVTAGTFDVYSEQWTKKGSLWNQFFPGNGDPDSWSHTFQSNNLVQSTNSQPLYWSHLMNPDIFSFSAGDTLYSGDISIRPAGNQSRSQTTRWPSIIQSASSCTGCQVRYIVNGSISYSRVIEMSSSRAIYFTDSLMFTDVLSPCLSTRSCEFTSSPTLRMLTLCYFVGNTNTQPLYGFSSLGTDPRSPDTTASVKFTV
jgi:hypothetical protein